MEVAVVEARVEEFILRIAVAIEVDARDAQPHGVAKRDVDHRLALERIIVAIFGLGGGFERPELGLGGDLIDHASGRVAAEQRALRYSSEERRVGKECVSTVKYRWLLYP